MSKDKGVLAVDRDLLMVWTWMVGLTASAMAASIQFLARGTCSLGVTCWAIVDIAGLWWSASRVRP